MTNWDERFRTGALTNDPPLAVVEMAIAAAPPGLALDLASGPGRHACLLAQRGWRVTAVDSSRVALEQLNARCPSVATIHADLAAAYFAIEPAAWDLIVMSLCYLPELWPAIRRGIRPGGLFAGAFLTSGRFAIRPGEIEREFGGWQLLHCQEHTAGHGRLEVLARRSDAGDEPPPLTNEGNEPPVR